MAYTPTRLYHGQPAQTATVTDCWTTAQAVIVKQLVLCNTTTSGKWITVGLCPSAASLAASNHILSQVVVPPNSTLTFDVSLVLASGDYIRATQETSGSITLSIHGVTF